MKAKAKDSKVKTTITKGEANPKAIAKVKEYKDKLLAYLLKNKLDPTKDYSKDKKHGAIIKEYTSIIKVNQEKVKDAIPPEQHHKKIRVADKVSTTKDVKPKAIKVTKVPKDGRKVVKYEYPKVDGKEMTSEEKKKYRSKMRAEERGNTRIPKEAVPLKQAKEKLPMGSVPKEEEPKKKLKKSLKKTVKKSKED